MTEPATLSAFKLANGDYPDGNAPTITMPLKLDSPADRKLQQGDLVGAPFEMETADLGFVSFTVTRAERIVWDGMAYWNLWD